MSKMYICVLDEVPDFIVPCLVGHSVLRHHLAWDRACSDYSLWLTESFRKCVVSVSQKEFDNISKLSFPLTHSWENSTLEGRHSCITVVVGDEVPNVLKYSKLWRPKV